MTNETKKHRIPSLLEGLLSSVNLETKSVALLATDSEWKESREIWEKTKELAPSYPLTHDCVARYFLPCFVPHGMAKVLNTSENIEGARPSYQYAITLNGQLFGKPVALLALEYTARNNQSLRYLLGRSNIQDTKEPGVTRNAKLLHKIYSSGGKARIPVQDNLNTNIAMLESFGIVQTDNDRSRNVTLTDKGLNLVEQFLAPVMNASDNPQEMAKLQNRYSGISREELSQICDKAVQIPSPKLGGNYVSFDERAGIMYGLIAAKPGMSRQELVSSMRVHKNTVNWHLRTLLSDDRVREKEGQFYIK